MKKTLVCNNIVRGTVQCVLCVFIESIMCTDGVTLMTDLSLVVVNEADATSAKW